MLESCKENMKTLQSLMPTGKDTSVKPCEEIFEKLGGDGCVGEAMVSLIKTANNSTSWLRNTNYPMTHELAIKNKDMCWVCKKKFVEGNGDIVVPY